MKGFIEVTQMIPDGDGHKWLTRSLGLRFIETFYGITSDPHVKTNINSCQESIRVIESYEEIKALIAAAQEEGKG